MSRPSEQALRSLESYRAPNWFFQDDGYYIHRNRVYLQGSAVNFGSPAVGGTLFTGVPGDMRPSTTLTAHTVLIAPDPATPGITVPTTTTMTITPDGSLSIPVPPYANAAPTLTDLGSYQGTTPRPMFPDPFEYVVVLGNVSWLIGESHGAYTTESLAPHLDGDSFEDIDATIGLHDARVHISGHVRAKHNGVHRITISLPPEYTSAIDPDSGDFTTVKAPRFEAALTLGPSGRLDIANQDGRPPLDPPPTYQSPSNTQDVAINLVGTADSVVAGLAGQPTRIIDTFGHGVPATGSWTGPEPGGERIQASFSPGVGAFLTPTTPGMFTEITSQLAAFGPPPDWVGVQLLWDTGAPSPFGDDTSGYRAPTDIAIMSDVPCVLRNFHDGSVMGSLPMGVGVAGTGSDTGYPAGRGEGKGQGWLAPASGGYSVDPNNEGAALLWRPEEAPNAFELVVVDGVAYGLEGIGFVAWLIPFWYTRRHWVLKDDVIDLTGGGWQAPFTAPEIAPTPSTVTPGPGTPGVKPRHSVLGHSQPPKVTGASGTSLGTFLATAYGPPWDAIEGTGVTSTGIALSPSPGPQDHYVIAVDPSVIPYHTKVRVDPNPFGDTSIVFSAEDTGGAIIGNHIDIYIAAGRAEQNGWGARNVTVYVV